MTGQTTSSGAEGAMIVPVRKCASVLPGLAAFCLLILAYVLTFSHY
jgi:hypothetical protein